MSAFESSRGQLFRLDLGDITLAVEDVWPDGNAPANPTAQDVADVIDSCGGASCVVREWNLLDGISIVGNGEAFVR